MKTVLDRVVIKPLPAETTKGGIFIPDSAQKMQHRAEVIAIGKPKFPQFKGLRVGDMVDYGVNAGITCGDHTFISHGDIFKIIRGEEEYSYGLGVVVEVPKKYYDTIDIIGADGEKKELYYDPEYVGKSTHNLRYDAVVKLLPLPGAYIFDDIDRPITPVLKQGDKVYVRYIALDSHVNRLDKKSTDNSESFLARVYYHDIIAKDNSGEVETIGGWHLGEPFVDGEGKLVKMNNHDYKVRVQYHGNTSIIKSINNKLSETKCKVTHVSSFANEESTLNVGDTVFARRGLNFVNKINGKEYYCFYESTVEAVLT